MDIDRGTQAVLLEAMASRLIQQIPGANEGNCLVTDFEEPPQLLEDTVFTICAGDGQFDPTLWAGGGINTLTEDIAISVSVFRRWQLDRNDHAKTSLLSRDYGMVSHYKPTILRAILVGDDGNPWDPVYRNQRFLRDQLQPLSCSQPKPLNTDSPTYVFFTLRFRAYFDWSL